MRFFTRKPGYHRMHLVENPFHCDFHDYTHMHGYWHVSRTPNIFEGSALSIEGLVFVASWFILVEANATRMYKCQVSSLQTSQFRSPDVVYAGNASFCDVLWVTTVTDQCLVIFNQWKLMNENE